MSVFLEGKLRFEFGSSWSCVEKYNAPRAPIRLPEMLRRR